MLNPELSERLLPFLGGIANKMVSRLDASAELPTTLICCCHANHSLRPSLRDGVSRHYYPGTSCLATIRLSLRDKSHSK
jgi:hypothetical protein